MWEILKINRRFCSELCTTLEGRSELATARDYTDVLRALPASLRRHVGSCIQCQLSTNTFLASRALLAALPLVDNSPDSSFASRVMAQIAVREDQLRRRLDVWTTAVPRLAAKLTWATTAALLLATVVLYEGAPFAPPAPALSVNAGTPEYIFEVPATPTNKDEVLSTLLER